MWSQWWWDFGFQLLGWVSWCSLSVGPVVLNGTRIGSDEADTHLVNHLRSAFCAKSDWSWDLCWMKITIMIQSMKTWQSIKITRSCCAEILCIPALLRDRRSNPSKKKEQKTEFFLHFKRKSFQGSHMKITLIQVQLLLYIFTLPVSDIDHDLRNIRKTCRCKEFNSDWN